MPVDDDDDIFDEDVDQEEEQDRKDEEQAIGEEAEADADAEAEAEAEEPEQEEAETEEQAEEEEEEEQEEEDTQPVDDEEEEEIPELITPPPPPPRRPSTHKMRKRPRPSPPTPTPPVVKTKKQRLLRKCGLCKETDHNIRTCPLRQEEEEDYKPQVRPRSTRPKLLVSTSSSNDASVDLEVFVPRRTIKLRCRHVHKSSSAMSFIIKAEDSLTISQLIDNVKSTFNSDTLASCGIVDGIRTIMCDLNLTLHEHRLTDDTVLDFFDSFR